MKSKMCHNYMAQLLEVEFAEGDLIYLPQCQQGKLLPKVEGPYNFCQYANAVHSSMVIFNESI